MVVNGEEDTRWALPSPLPVTHIIPQEWHGIRAAAGYAPGHKIALPVQRNLPASKLREALREIERSQSRAVILHSFSENAETLMRLARRVMGDGIRLCALWHGNTAQFHFEPELRQLGHLLELKRRGILDAVGCVKPGMAQISPLIHPVTLLNFPPTMAPSDRRPPDGFLRGTAFLPVPNDWRKNFYTNAYAAIGVNRLRQVWVTAPHVTMPVFDPQRKITFVDRPTRKSVFHVITSVDLILNVTLSECQPMTALEGLAVGVPCLSGILQLGSLSEHPYAKLVEVPASDNVAEVRAAIERLLDLLQGSAGELSEMMRDYEQALRAEALTRYQEFVGP
jgi:hypothetical protein